MTIFSSIVGNPLFYNLGTDTISFYAIVFMFDLYLDTHTIFILVNRESVSVTEVINYKLNLLIYLLLTEDVNYTF